MTASVQCSSLSTLPKHYHHAHHSKPNIVTLVHRNSHQLLDHTYADNPDVAPLQPFNMRHSFNVRAKYADDIFLYNCELWTPTKTINDSLDAFHRRQLRYALGIKYPRVITNQQLYDVTKCEPWNIVTERRRLSWLGL